MDQKLKLHLTNLHRQLAHRNQMLKLELAETDPNCECIMQHSLEISRIANRIRSSAADPDILGITTEMNPKLQSIGHAS